MVPPLKTVKKDTLGATYEYINKLLRNENFDAQEFIKYNENLNVFEKKVQAIYIDTFKVKEGVINCLLSNDPHLVRRILKCDWFFEDALTPKCYEQDIFPNVSFSTRCKIINKLAKNVKSEQHAEELFEFTNANYGSKYAEMFLAKCSFQFISDYITKCEPAFDQHNSERNLINICKRFPDIVISILKDDLTKSGFRRPRERFTKLIKYLAKNHPLAFLPVFENYYKQFYFEFGKKSTKALCSELMKIVERTPGIVQDGRMDISVIFNRLTFDEQVILLKLLVRARSNEFSSQDFQGWSLASGDMMNLIKLKPLNERVRLVETVFFQLFNEKYIDHPEVWSVRFLEVFPIDYRARLVEVLQEKSGEKTIRHMLELQCSDNERDAKDILIYLLSCKTAFPLLTQKMSQMAKIDRREILLIEMIWNSIINRDPEGYESVVRYISTRHKNEDPVILRNLVHHLLSCPYIVNSNAWDLLEKMVTLWLVNLKENNLYGQVLESYVAFKLKHNLDARPQIKNMIKLNFASSTTSSVLVRKIDKSYSKTLIMLYYNEIFSGDSEYDAEQIREKLVLSLLLSVNEYNKTVKRTRINIEELPSLIEAIDKIIQKKDEWKNNYLFTKAVLENKFLKNRYSRILLDFSMKPKTLQYLLKSHPDDIVYSLDKIMNYVFDLNKNEKFEKLFTSRCQIDFFEWMPKLEKVIYEKFKSSVSSSVKVNALKSYSHIANLEDFTEFVKEYLPTQERFQFDQSKADFHEIQINVPRVIRNVKPVSKNVELVLKYLKKDFLRWVIPSFFSVCNNSSVNVILPILRDHFPQKKEVSVKKVILCCILNLLSKVEKFNYCKFLWENEGHSSVKEVLFTAISKMLNEDPSKEVFEMVKKCIMEADEVTIKGMLSMNKIPLRFLGEYSNILWAFTEKYEGRRFALNYRSKLLNHFNSDKVSVLSKEFCEKVLSLYLFKSDNEIRVESFCCHFLLHHPQAMDQKLSFLLALMRERHTDYSAVVDFINCLKNKARSNPQPIFVIFDALLKEWPKMYGTSKMFREYLLLNYMKGYSTALEISNSQNESFDAALGKELRKVVNAIPNYEYCIEIFNNTLSDFMFDFKLYDVKTVMNNFLGTSFGLAEGIIAINQLPSEMFDTYKINIKRPEYNLPRNISIREKYSNIYKKLMDRNDDILKIYMNQRMDNALD